MSIVDEAWEEHYEKAQREHAVIVAALRAEVERLTWVKQRFFEMFKRRNERTAELRARSLKPTAPMQGPWDGLVGRYENAPRGSMMREVIDTAEKLISTLHHNLATLEQEVVDLRAQVHRSKLP